MRCEDKVRYPTRKAALSSASVRRKETGLDIEIYKCPKCHYYHLTSHPRRKVA